MGYSRKLTKQEIIEIILDCRGENHSQEDHSNRMSYFELEHHKLMRLKRADLIKLAEGEIDKWEEAHGKEPRLHDLYLYNDSKKMNRRNTQ